MLRTLRRIIQKATSASNLSEALECMVEEVRHALQTEAASIFLIDARAGEYILMATDGLNAEAVGVRVPINKGLVGLVGRREEPINLENATEHTDYFTHPDAGEEKFKAFLGAPMIHHRRLFGVLVIQQTEARRFDEAEEAFLVTVATQLARIVAHADNAGSLDKLAGFTPHSTESEEAAIGGIPSSTGVGIGQAVVVYPPADLDAVPDKPADDLDAEIAAFDHAISSARDEIHQLAERMRKTLPPAEHALFDVYARILDSRSLGAEVIAEIKSGLWAQAALRNVINEHVKQFTAMEDAYLSERADDFKDLGRRILSHLQARQVKKIEYPDDTVLVGDEISAAALAGVPEGCLKAVVSSSGSSNSHVAILARALGVPAVMGARGIAVGGLDGKRVVVDGYFGQVYVEPSKSLLHEFELLEIEEHELNQSLEGLRAEPAMTPDGYRVSLQVNTGLAVDAGLSLSVGAEGVGLYRSEVPFMVRERFPSEEEQLVIYRQLSKAFAPRPVTMRTLDIGGDKALPYFPVEELNPFLGWRGIRITLDHPDIFLIQLRAMMRAHEKTKNIRIMLPMISSIGELDESMHLITQAHNELLDEGLNCELPPIGVMIEVPSAIYQIRDIARRVDFLSVGSNDLTQYLLAVDRNNPRVSGLYDALHPAVLRAMIQVIEGAHAEGKPVGICGEMASDPVAVILLLAMGFDSLSMNSNSLLRMKWVIRNVTLAYARKLLSEALTMDNPTLIRFHLEKAIDQLGLGGLIRAGKR